MEKLMQYVEQMQKEGINVCRPQVQQYDILYMILISKHYPLIKWLVKNDKIDIFKSGIEDLPAMFGYDYESVECKSDRLVMMLSIQNNPIEYLVSILK